MDCIYSNYDDGGNALKNEIKKFESLLIQKKILKDATGESYASIFEK